MQTIQVISISGGTPTVLPSLIFIVAVSMVKDAWEEYQRHERDQVENGATVHKFDFTKAEFTNEKCQDIRVGDFVQVKKDEVVPADLLVLHINQSRGTKCFVETRNLDGESNLKPKELPKELRGMLKKLQDLKEIKGHLECNIPDDCLHHFAGTLTIQGEDIAVDADNLVLRGCSLKNTQSFIGMAVYAGHDTKIMLNS